MIRQLTRKLFTLEQWSVGWAKVGIDQFLRDPGSADFKWITPRSARELIADPFGLEENGKLVIFAEQLIYGKSAGQILRLETEGLHARQTLLRRPWHLSYPFVVEEAGRRFIVPEQSQSGTVAFYPYASGEVGEPSAILEGFDAVDSTFLFHEGRWWLFCTHAYSPNGALHLYFSDRLLGPYRPHPMNPIVTDPSRARPGGRIIRSPDGLLRPAQDCSQSYGMALVLCKIEALTLNEYKERPITRIEPGQLRGGFAEGLHTLDHTEHYVVLDTKRFAPSLSAAALKAARFVKRFRSPRRTGSSARI